MFQYGLIGNIIHYGGFTAIFGYLGYELYTIGNQTVNIPEEFASELLDPKHVKRMAQSGKILQSDKEQQLDYQYIAKQMALNKDYENPIDNQIKEQQEKQKIQIKNQQRQKKVQELEPDI